MSQRNRVKSILLTLSLYSLSSMATASVDLIIMAFAITSVGNLLITALIISVVFSTMPVTLCMLTISCGTKFCNTAERFDGVVVVSCSILLKTSSHQPLPVLAPFRISSTYDRKRCMPISSIRVVPFNAEQMRRVKWESEVMRISSVAFIKSSHRVLY